MRNNEELGPAGTSQVFCTHHPLLPAWEGAILTVDCVFSIEDPPTYIRLAERVQKKGIFPSHFYGTKKNKYKHVLLGLIKVSTAWLQGDTLTVFS